MPGDGLVRLAVPGAALTFDPAVGMVTDLVLGEVAPLYAAPWRADAAVQADPAIALVERRLAGDFLCAPFGEAAPGVPLHGWPANSPWMQTGAAAGRLDFALERRVEGAAVTVAVRLAEGSPVLWQAHEIAGGAGSVTVAHHPMLRLAAGGWLSVSAKRSALTGAPLEPGRARLAPHTRGTELGAFPGTAGPVDLMRYEPGTGHEDFVTLVEAPGAALGWTAVIREAEDDLVLVLKDPAVLPVTMLWLSNGGRDYAPWNGRHTGVLGIEDGCAAGALDLAAARGPNPVAAEGVATVLPLGPGVRHVIHHAIAAVPRPAGWTRVTEVRRMAGSLEVVEASGATLTIPVPPDCPLGR